MRELKLAARGAYKFPRQGMWIVRHLKYGNTHYGWFLTIKTAAGRPLNIYFARRAIAEKLQRFDAWPIECAAITVLKQHGCTFAGVYADDGTMLLAPMSVFKADETAGVKVIDRRSQGRGLMYSVPESLFQKWAPPPEEVTATVLANMHLKRTRATKPKPTAVAAV